VCGGTVCTNYFCYVSINSTRFYNCDISLMRDVYCSAVGVFSMESVNMRVLISFLVLDSQNSKALKDDKLMALGVYEA